MISRGRNFSSYAANICRMRSLGQSTFANISTATAAVDTVKDDPIYRYTPSAEGIQVSPANYRYSELENRFSKSKSKNIKLRALDIDKDVYYETPQSLVSRIGVCDALHKIFERDGIWIPWIGGTQYIEPGIFHPDKTWSQMVTESNKLRTDPSNMWDYCEEDFVSNLQVWKAPLYAKEGTIKHREDGKIFDVSILKRNPAFKITTDSNDTFCDEANAEGITASWSFSLPPKYKTNPIVLSTAARWLDTYSKGKPNPPYQPTGKGNIFCIRSAPIAVTTDAQWGHTYKKFSYVVAKIGADGIAEGPITRVDEGPIARVEFSNIDLAKTILAIAIPVDILSIYAANKYGTSGLGRCGLGADSVTGRWDLTATQIRKIISVGKWPIPGSVSYTWLDNGQQFDPNTLLQAPAGTQTGGVQTAGVLVAGGIGFAILALIFGKVS